MSRESQPNLEYRREVVGKLALRNLSSQQIAALLPEYDCVKPNGTSYGVQTVRNDLALLSERWREESAKDLSDHFSKQLARLDMIQEEALAREDLKLALEAHDRQSKLLGTNAPERREVKGGGGGPMAGLLKVVDAMSDDQVRELAYDNEKQDGERFGLTGGEEPEALESPEHKESD